MSNAQSAAAELIVCLASFGQTGLVAVVDTHMSGYSTSERDKVRVIEETDQSATGPLLTYGIYLSVFICKPFASLLRNTNLNSSTLMLWCNQVQSLTEYSMAIKCKLLAANCLTEV